MPASSKQRERRSGWRGSGAEVPATLTALSLLRGRWSWRSRPSCHVPAPRGRRSCRGQAPSFKAFFPGVRTSLHVLGPKRGHALGWRLPSREVRDLLLNRMIMRERGSFAPRRPKSRSQEPVRSWLPCHHGAFLALPPGLAHVLFRAQASITFHVPVTGAQQHRHGYRPVHREPVDHVRTVSACGAPGRNASSQIPALGLRAVDSGQEAKLLCAPHICKMMMKYIPRRACAGIK